MNISGGGDDDWRAETGNSSEAAAYLHRGPRRWVWGDRAALTGGGPVRRRPSGRRPGSAASVAEARHHLSGSLWEDELLPQLHVGPAFSWGTTAESTTLGKNGPPSKFSCSLRWWSALWSPSFFNNWRRIWSFWCRVPQNLIFGEKLQKYAQIK